MAIKTTNGFFNWLKSKFYLKTEIDSKLADKASTDVASTSANGLMSSTDKVKLDGVEEGANNITVDSAMSSTSTNPVQNKVVKAELDSLNNNKANIMHTHGEAYSATTLRSNTFCQVLGNIAIVSWWSGAVNISKTGGWVDLWTLPVTNKGKAVWTENIHNGGGTVLYFKVEAGSNKVQALSSIKTGSLSHHPGQLVFFIE